MAFENAPITPAPQERVSFLVLEAAKRVRVDEYLRLRFAPRMGISGDETRQVCLGAQVINQILEKNENRPFKLTDKLEFSVDPLVNGARLMLTNKPFPEYLEARRQLLEKAIGINIRTHYQLENTGGQEKDLLKVTNRIANLVENLNLTNAVAAAAGITA